MAEIVHMNVPTYLLGKWRSEEDDARSEYDVYLDNGVLNVSGRDYLDGERYIISNVSYKKDKLEFDTLMQSTGRKGNITLIRTNEPDRAEMQFTFTDIVFVSKISNHSPT